ncbi:TTL-domain-containing protein [Cyathus striatus]|nr:TTL-domain-containing protein [Cyathus striatus]
MSPDSPSLTILLSWSSAPFTSSLVHHALYPFPSHAQIVSSLPNALSDALPTSPSRFLLQWSTYDHIDHELTHFCRKNVLSSSYTFRKALIRKHFLSRLIHSYVTKHPSASLARAAPKTFEVEISFADELDEMWADELWELGESLEDGSSTWWILKPGMADRGMGIRLFNSKEGLHNIFEEFEQEDDQEESSDQERDDHETTAVVTSQLRHFVIQEYILSPLLVDPAQIPINGQPTPETLLGYKFHLRVYCVASGAIQLFLYDRILALFSSSPYINPNVQNKARRDFIDLTPHLTNTSLQTHRGEEGVRLLEELIGCRILYSGGDEERIFTREDMTFIRGQMVDILTETFQAALQNPVHFQPLPNAFELYGVDFLIDYDPLSTTYFQTKILEINAEPAIELTGPRLSWILEDLFASIKRVCVDPFLRNAGVLPDADLDTLPWAVGETRHHLVKCMEEAIRSLD